MNSTTTYAPPSPPPPSTTPTRHNITQPRMLLLHYPGVYTITYATPSYYTEALTISLHTLLRPTEPELRSTTLPRVTTLLRHSLTYLKELLEPKFIFYLIMFKCGGDIVTGNWLFLSIVRKLIFLMTVIICLVKLLLINAKFHAKKIIYFF
jgi:hypothetical protein